jgi:hypothetical protein
MKTDKIIYCIGDSHVSVFGGVNKMSDGWPSVYDILPQFRTYKLGPVLAYNTATEFHSTRSVLFTILNLIPAKSSVLLCYGEIDCRVHILKQAELKKTNADIITKECAERYFGTVQEIKNLGFNVIVWAAIPTKSCDIFKYVEDKEKYPHYGSYAKRNQITKIFNDTLEQQCKENSILFTSLFDKLIDENLRAKDKEYYIDSVHLSQKAMPLIIEAFENIGF